MQIESEKIIEFVKINQLSPLFSSQEEQDNWFKDIKGKPAYQPLIHEIKEEAEQLLKDPLRELTFSEFTIFRDTGSRLEYERRYFAKRRRLNTFAIMSLLEPIQSIYLKELQETIWSICNEFSWCLPAHLKNSPEMDANINQTFFQVNQNPRNTIDLFAAETAFALSEIFSLTKHLLDPLIQKRMIDEVYRRVLLPYQNQSFEWEKSTHNWAAVCAGSIGAAALHIVADERMLSTTIERVLHTMNYYLKGFNDDGACMEGYGYWQYGFGFYVYFADLLKKKTDGVLDLLNTEKVHQIALFQQKCFINKNQVVNFSDSPEKGAVLLGLSHYLHEIYPDLEVPEVELRASFNEDHCSRWASAIRNLIWFDEQKTGEKWQDDTYYLKDSQWLISRNDGYVFACKGGHNDEPHNHNDIGHFILQVKGETFLKDLGSGMYCDAYFNHERYTFLCNGSQGHSVPIINNQYQSEGAENYATITQISTEQAEDILEMNLAKAYEIEVLEKLIRRFTWKKSQKPELVLEDTFHFTEKPESIIERFITPVMKITEDSTGVILEGKEKLKICFNRDEIDLVVRENEFLNHFGVKEELFQFDFLVKKPSEMTNLEIRFHFL
ncbi:heparinase II/III domain-containing protein [Metabacillus halosaccharovorans]|uniref:heparinase II/III domain-containing protein n=1 Tax=Metabacillus halosaccharovorans TaxID=930124 RepID=UPI00203A4E39|nr:heparinase II/III family protein [Metabacillus halosaccharovorans]MCM3443645.1 heparinase II/III-family protein [Metabacillus halosaccharovorans]